jgi:glutaminyl-tRNA synthetase
MSYPESFDTEITNLANVEQVCTRFPPENNGFLHLGHVKAMEADFGYAEHKSGKCILRFDDTNPSAEKEEYYESILYDVKWLGYNSCYVTSTSDYFGLLYDFARLLIKKGEAYVCQLSPDEISEYRKNRTESPYKTRPIGESLKLFNEMKEGKYKEGEMTLRMNGSLENPNTTMWDFIMYRIIRTPHGKTGSEWCIYPTYDYSHGIIDSIEGITHSFCTKEYEIRREQYYWSIDKLNLRRPFVYEFGRLDIEGETMSKRKIKEMVENSIVNGWDDPRLLTIGGLRRRGYLPEVLREFCRETGITKCEAKYEGRLLLESKLRDKLNLIAPRRMVVFEPLKLVITNLPSDDMRASAKDFPFDENSDIREIQITQEVYIDKKEFKEVDEKGFYGLAPNKIVLLKYGVYVEYESYDKENNIVFVKIVSKPEKKVKGVLNWVNSNFTEVFVRSFDKLRVWTQLCYAEEYLNKAFLNPLDKFQFEKHGYYCVDYDLLDEKVVFNESVKLKSSY